MRGPLIEMEARDILYQGRREGLVEGRKEGREETALNMLKRGKLTIEEIAEDSGLSVEEVEQLAKIQTV